MTEGRVGLAGVVLAAGASRRMGRPKPLLPLGQSTYLEAILATLADAGVERRLVILGSRAGTVRRRVRLDDAEVVHHRGWRSGMLGSLQAGIARLCADRTIAAALVVPVDVPRFDVTTVVALARAAGSPKLLIALPTYGGRHGHPALFGRATWNELLDAPPDRGARAVVDAHREEIVEVAVDDPWILRDADTPAEHRRMIEGLEA